jgi:2-polyprenyl-3-methyl-5-hydroxy-6-metoxy-1,4-benzoquinol methylase
MKDHIKAKWINKITGDAVKYCGTQQLRERLHDHIIGLIEVVDREARQEQRMKDVILCDEMAKHYAKIRAVAKEIATRRLADEIRDV